MLGGGGSHGLEKGFEQPPGKSLPGWQPGPWTTQTHSHSGRGEYMCAAEPHSPWGLCHIRVRHCGMAGGHLRAHPDVLTGLGAEVFLRCHVKIKLKRIAVK